MVNRISVVLVGFSLLLCALKANAQSGTISSGGDASGAGGSVSYSIGQTNHLTVSSAGGTITEGLQQPYEISIVTGKEETDIHLTASVYPNPTSNGIILSTASMDVQNMTYCLTDINGKVLSTSALNKKQTTIPMTSFASGTYFVQILNNKNVIKSFKIIKSN